MPVGRTNRRAFISGLGSAATWSIVASAQSDGVRRIGVLQNLAADDPEGQARLAAFLQGLQQLGWTTGRNLRIDARWAGIDAADTRKYAAELVALAPDLILAAGSASAGPLLETNRKVPIVFVLVIDPSAPALSIAWRDPAAMLRGSQISNTS